jgi:cation diffusion facilitator CzcD-associated flavoprotein CzcO
MSTQAVDSGGADSVNDWSFDAIVIGVGVAGLYQLYQLRELGLRVQAFEAGSGVGGTWYWNRYPGARFDSESWTYGYSFSQELLDEWDWQEHFAPQPETERYLNYVADKFDLRRDIQFDSRVAAARYREESRSWEIALEDGRHYSTRFLITAIGILSAPTMPNIPGIDAFKGRACHTHAWPKEGVDFTGKRVGIIGTGATAVQTIQEIAKTVGHLTVFQRTPNWCAPLHNDKISKDEMRDIRSRYDEIFALCSISPGCYIHAPDPRKTLETSPEDREAFWERLYDSPGFGVWMGQFSDTLTDREANRLASDFIAKKIRQRVKDPAVAEKLIPKNHGLGTRRVPLETGYYEVYNQPNVELVDINDTPIERITPNGIKTSEREYEFDTIIYATGFDAITGAFDRIDISGIDGLQLRGCMERRPADLSRCFGRRLSEPADGYGPARRARQLHAHRGIQRRVGHRLGSVRDGARPDPDRGHGGRCRRMDRARAGAWGGPADERDRLVDDRRQPQCRGQAETQDHALQRRPPRLSRALRRCCSGCLPQARAGVAGPAMLMELRTG